MRPNVAEIWIRLLATIGGLGNMRVAPGTWGSVVGLVIGWWVVSAFHGIGLAMGLVVSFLLSVWICTRAEALLARHDPPAIILDEVWGMVTVIGCLPWVISSWLWLMISFVVFRIFDIIKPAPLPWFAKAPGGLGIMADDLGAALYTVGLLWLLQNLL